MRPWMVDIRHGINPWMVDIHYDSGEMWPFYVKVTHGIWPVGDALAWTLRGAQRKAERIIRRAKRVNARNAKLRERINAL